ncbi:gamma-parvin isoform X2 [Gouania willdenowi]|uniref:gamma-parvin isoform X2 n=1 Tax=Gouania willdenowi TaxID=441366 RepID=UPI001055E3DA|nr:gamma-parvin-like isoform X2 [Gouania willdenowi]
MDSDKFEPYKEDHTVEVQPAIGEKRKVIQPTYLKDPQLAKLKEALVDWINRTLKSEHIVIQSLEEDLYDGLVFHHLLSRLTGVHLDIGEMALTSTAQICKLEAVLKELDLRLGLKDSSRIRWDVQLIHNKDLLASIHLLVAMVRHFQPDLDLPSSVKVEVVVVEVSRSGIKSHVQMEDLTEDRAAASDSHSRAEREEAFDELLKLEDHELSNVKEVILQFVNQNMLTLGLQVSNVDRQFSDGVILLLLIGQLEGFFVPLSYFNLNPVTHSEMLHNVTLALDLLQDTGLQLSHVDPNDIVSQDISATLKVLHALFRKHK